MDLTGFLTRHVEAGLVSGAVTVLAEPGSEPEIVAVGAMSLGGPPMSPNAIMRIQSMTKTVTAIATLRLVEKGQLALDDDVTRWLPELADRRVLRDPGGALDDTEPAGRPITVRHLLTNMSGYGMATIDCPLADAMAANETAASAAPVTLGADEWLARLAELPLAFQPGQGWRYHHSFGILGVLLARVVGRPLGEHLTDDLFTPLGMVDTGFYVPQQKLDRLPAAYRYDSGELLDTEPLHGGFYADLPPFDVSHAELVSTATDFLAFVRLIGADGRLPDGTRYLRGVAELRTDQVPDSAKTDDAFYPGFWTGLGWGYGLAVQTGGPHRGRIGWSGGQGTDYFIDPDGGAGILLTQTELGAETMPIITEFQELRSTRAP